jgi:hypothetical protein
MAKVNIQTAAKLAGITRQHLHKKYLHPKDKAGNALPPLLSVEQDHQGNTRIDTTEIIRVFGVLKEDVDIDDSQDLSQKLHELTQQNVNRIEGLQAESQLLREQLGAAQDRERAALERERWLQSQVEALTGAIKMLEHRPADPPAAAPPRRGFWSRVFGGGE